MDSKKKNKKKKKVVKPSQSSTNATVAKSITPTMILKDSFDPSKFISDKSKPYGEMWSAITAEDRARHLFVVKVLFHAPFLFNQPTGLFDQAQKKAVAMELLPADGVWPMSLERLKLMTIKKIGVLLDMMLSAMCEEVTFFQFLVDPEPYGLTEDQTNSGLLQYLKSRETSSDMMQSLDKEESSLQAHMTIIKLHLSQYILSLNLSHPELTVNDFFAGRSQREQQVAVVKERGCNNMKSDKVKAAIADFTRAIRVCPYCSELYYQRASCFRKTRERWQMVIDSYRAVITEPSDPKVYLLLADAWCEMGQEYDHAKEALVTGQRLCKEGVEQLTNRYDELDKLQKEHEEENERNWNEIRARRGLEEDRMAMEDPLKRKEALLQEELRHYSSKKKMLSEEKSDRNKTSIPYRSHKITLPDLGPIEFEQLDLPQLPTNVTLEKLLELANQTSCSYLDINQYLIYPSDEDSDESVRSWTTDETPHYRQQAGGGGKSSDESEFEELSCPSLVSDDDDDVIEESCDQDDVINELHNQDQDNVVNESHDQDVINGSHDQDDVSGSHDQDDVSGSHDQDKVSGSQDQDGKITADQMEMFSEEPSKSDTGVSDVTKVSHDADDVVPSLPSLQSLDTKSNGVSHDLFPDEETKKRTVSLESSDLPPFDLEMIPSESPDLEPLESPDDVEVTVTMPDPAAMLPVIPPPVSHDLVTTPPDPITLSFGSHDPEQSASPDLLAALHDESHDTVTTPLESHDIAIESHDTVDTPLKSHESAIESHDTVDTALKSHESAIESHDSMDIPCESHDVTAPVGSHDTVATPTDSHGGVVSSTDTPLDHDMDTPPSTPSSVNDLDLD